MMGKAQNNDSILLQYLLSAMAIACQKRNISIGFRWDNMADYRERIRNIREDQDLTQAQLGQLLNKSQQGYNHIETGRAELKVEDLVKLCKFYNLSADYLIGLTDQKHSYK